MNPWLLSDGWRAAEPPGAAWAVPLGEEALVVAPAALPEDDPPDGEDVEAELTELPVEGMEERWDDSVAEDDPPEEDVEELTELPVEGVEENWDDPVDEGLPPELPGEVPDGLVEEVEDPEEAPDGLVEEDAEWLKELVLERPVGLPEDVLLEDMLPTPAVEATLEALLTDPPAPELPELSTRLPVLPVLVPGLPAELLGLPPTASLP